MKLILIIDSNGHLNTYHHTKENLQQIRHDLIEVGICDEDEFDDKDEDYLPTGRIFNNMINIIDVDEVTDYLSTKNPFS